MISAFAAERPHQTTTPPAQVISEVEARLIAAFVALPNTPVFRLGARVVHAAGGQTSILTDTLNWAALLDEDPSGRCYLWAWARCRARGESFGELCRGMGWPRNTAEIGRRRAAGAIATALAAEAKLGLDSGKARLGFSTDIVGDLTPADAG